MSNVELKNVRIVLRNDISSNWKTTNPVLLKGEMGIETDTKKFKFGDGVTQYNSLAYVSAEKAVVQSKAPSASDSGYDIGTLWVDSSEKKSYILCDNSESAAVWKKIITADDVTSLGKGDMLKSDFATNEKAGQGYVDKAIASDKLSSEKNITLRGDVSGTTTFDGSKNAEMSVTLADTSVVAGTYTKITVDSKGRATKGESLIASDIPELPKEKITGIGTAAEKDVGIAEGNVPVLGVNGKLDDKVLPSIAITDTFEADSEAAMLKLNAQKGDVCIRSDVNQTFILKNDVATLAENWVVLKTPTDAVLSVNGKTGAVTLKTDDVAEGERNQYYTEERASANFKTHASTELTDADDLIKKSVSYILNCGSATVQAQ